MLNKQDVKISDQEKNICALIRRARGSLWPRRFMALYAGQLRVRNPLVGQAGRGSDR